MATAASLLPILNENTNFSTWKYRVKLILEEKQVAYVLSTEKLEETKKEQYKKDDAKAKSLIAQSCCDKYIDVIKNGGTAKEMINLLENIFERKSVYNRFHLKRKLITMKCSEPLQSYFIKFSGLISQLSAIDVKIDEEDQICYLLSSLPKEYDQVITAIETMATENKLSFDLVKGRLLDAETKIKGTVTEQENAFTCYTCGKAGHKSFECANRDRNSERGRQREHGRGFRGNRSRGRSYGRGRGRFSSQQAAAVDTGTEIGFIMSESAVHKAFVSDNGYIDFVVDSGCTSHLVSENYEKFMQDIKFLDKSIKIYVANGQYITTNKIGKLKIKYLHKTINIEALIVKNVTYNLLSVKKIVEAGFKVNFTKECVEIFDKNTYLKGECQGRLYTIKAEICQVETCAIGVLHNDLWHKRLGHLNRKSLARMNLPISKKVCDSCMTGKATRSPFKPMSRPRSTSVAELLHTDIAGPVKEAGPNGEKYFVTITDDYSHFCVVYPITQKSQATEKLINYILKLENQTGNKVKRIRSDNGGEYHANRLVEFCRQKGIRQEFTMTYTPQENGVSERMNRTLCDKTRTMLAETNLPKHLWCEAIQCAAYQLNRSPSWAINFATPCKIFYGKNDLSRLRVFGAKAWATIIPKPDKLSKRAMEVRMVGYNVVGYRLWNPETDTIITSRDVKFDETDIQYMEKKKDSKERRILIDENETEKSEDEPVNTTECENENKDKDDEPISTKCEEENKEEEENNESNDNTNKTTRAGRALKTPTYLKDYEINNVVYCLCTDVPKSFEDAIEDKEWKTAIDKEINALKELDTWEETDNVKGKKAIETKWIFKEKDDGTKKARLVARGFQVQKEDKFDVMYAPVARMSTVRMVIAKAVDEDLPIRQLDIPTAFLNGQLKSEIYIKIPKGLEITNSNKILKLKRALYGLTESPRCWNDRIDSFAKQQGFVRSDYDYCLYSKENCWMLIFVDDIILTGIKEKIKETVIALKEEFKAKDLGEMKSFLGMEIERQKGILKIKQTKLIDKILKKFKMTECNGARTPMETNLKIEQPSEDNIIDVPYRELIGSLIYISSSTRPDLTYAVSYLSRYLDKPNEQTWKAGKRILRYLNATKERGLTFKKSDDTKLYAYSDADWAADHHDRKSVSGCLIFCGINPVAWFSKKQNCVSLSTAESEYIAAAATAQELINLQGIAASLHNLREGVLLVDNRSAICMAKSYENSKRTKHIDIKAHFIKDLVINNKIQIEHVSTNLNYADIMTKSLAKEKMDNFICKIIV